jgi:CRP-like cAMP-binding protein
VNEQKFHRGRVIFREGYSGDSLYYIFYGTVGIYVNYGKNDQRMLAELTTGDYFGEMGLLDGGKRTATAVALENDTVLDCITEAEFDRFMQENPGRVMDIMKRLCHKLRNTTAAYVNLCKDVESAVGSAADTVDEGTDYGFESNENLKAVHDGLEA